MPDFIVIGHRGARGHEPENTLLSVRKALSLGVEWIEVDVYSVLGKLMVIHDERLERTTNGKGYLEEQTIEYLRYLDAGKGEKIPFLEEVLDTIGANRKINIELKGENTAVPVANLITEYITRNGWSNDNFLVSSFNHHELKKFKELFPEIRIGALTAALPFNYAKFGLELKAYSIHASLEFVNKAFVNDAHKRGMKFFVYTVNREEDVKRMRDLGVDGIFTDFPELSQLDS